MPAQLKRKRPMGGPQISGVATPTVAVTAPAAPTRTTRQSSNPPPPVRHTRHRAEADGEPTESSQPSRSPRGKENIPVHPEQQRQRVQHTKPTTRLTRHSANQEAPAAPRHSHTNTHHAKPATNARLAENNSMTPLVTQRPTAASRAVPSTVAAPGRQGRRASATDPFVPHQQSVSVGRNKPIIMTTSNPMSNPNGAPVGAARATDSAGRPDRNIDKVVLGDICFRTWYPSYYGKEVLGDISGHSAKGGKGTKSNGNSHGAAPHNHHEARDDTSGGKTHGRRDRDNHPAMLDRLYVCPCCFKYSKELVTWWEHVRWCERRGVMPGRKIYTHPKGKRTVLVPSGPVPKQGRGKRASVGQKMVEELVQDEGEWSVWEVDGEDDVLFCQNLSLFAKLFLDNKSVFFDVTGFKYFLLAYTPATRPSADPTETSQPRSQIVGFFSKEKMSWDNNNLACILIFPPWQRKGLGALLMGLSYEISRREGLLGGPEKPISELGKRGYKRFWAGEIARWLLSLVPSASKPPDPEEEQDTKQEQETETVVDIDHCSQATWISPEDCLLVLREMGLAEHAGTGPRAAAATALRVQEPTAKAEEENAQGTGGGVGVTAEPAAVAAAAAAATATTPTAATAAAVDHQVVVQRVRISQAAVRAWVAANKISLERACDPDGFVEGYASTASKAVSEEPV